MGTTAARDRQGLEVLPLDRCLMLIDRCPVGRVAFVAEGQPVIVPVNHRLDGRTIVFRTAPGSKLHAAARGAQFAFEVDGSSVYDRSGWSVVVRGPGEEVVDDQEIQRLASLGVVPWADGTQRRGWVRIRPDEITGRRIVRPTRMI